VTEVLRQTGPSEGVAATSLEMLERGVVSLHALLDDLTMQARLDAGQETRDIRPFDVSKALHELCALGEVAATERGLFLHCAGPERLLVEGDEVKVRRIAQNLLQNALMYTDKGGINVTWEQLKEPPKRWVMCVQDTGPGLATSAAAPLAAAIEAATRDTLAAQGDFHESGDPAAVQRPAPTMRSLSPVPAQLHGEGVGLSIVKRLCELLDAAIELQTEPGKGTTFRVTFPCKYPKG
jgi:signal transduction histidine kinase